MQACCLKRLVMYLVDINDKFTKIFEIRISIHSNMNENLSKSIGETNHINLALIKDNWLVISCIQGWEEDYILRFLFLSCMSHTGPFVREEKSPYQTWCEIRKIYILYHLSNWLILIQKISCRFFKIFQCMNFARPELCCFRMPTLRHHHNWR